MDRTTLRWLIAAATAIAALVCGTVLWIHGPENAQQWIASSVLAVSGVVGPVLLAWLGRDSDHDGIPDIIDRDPPPGGTGVSLLFVAAALSAASQGCSPSQLEIHADTAAVVGTGLAQADSVILERREADLEALVTAAREECGADGCAEPRATEIIDAYDARVEHWAPVLACREPVSQAYHAWLDALELAHTAASAELGLEHVLAEAARVGLLWRGFRECIETTSARLGDPLELPDIPAFVYPYLESAAR